MSSLATALHRRRQRGQAMTEAVVLLVVLIAALFAPWTGGLTPAEAIAVAVNDVLRATLVALAIV